MYTTTPNNTQNSPIPGAPATGRYATLAAVVGIASKRRPRTGSSSDVRTDDEESFFESIMSMGAGGGGGDGGVVSPLSSTVRLVGVGRAVLSDYFYRVPTEQTEEGGGGGGGDGDGDEDEDEEDGQLLAIDDWDDDLDDYWDGSDDDAADRTPIVMARFATLTDDNTVDPSADPSAVGTGGGRSVRSSPVHALNELSRVSRRVNFMHDDRRRLVSGLTTAKARLTLRRRRDAEEEEEEEEEEEFVYDDYDGLGLVGSSQSGDYSAQSSPAGEEDDGSDGGSMTVNEFLSRFQGGGGGTKSTAGSLDSSPDELARAEDRRKVSDGLSKLDNYGLGYYGSFSSIPDLTSTALDLFEPYYSDGHRSREEHALEVASFVAFRTLEGYADPADVAWALRSRSSLARLNRAYSIMYDHRMQLVTIAEDISKELLDCGEECTDLW